MAAASGVVEAGLEAALPVSDQWLREVVDEGLVRSIKERGYAIVQLPPHAREAVDRLRISQHKYLSSKEDKKKYALCHEVETHGISIVEDLKFYFQARSGGPGSALPFPGAPAEHDTDFGIDTLDVYADLDLLGRACLVELAKPLGVNISKLVAMLDPAVNIDMQNMTPAELKAVNIKSVREGETVYSPLFIPKYVSSSNLDLFYYFNHAETEEKWKSNHPSHTDSGIISLIPTSDQAALDFFDQKLKHWIQIERLVQEQAPSLGLSYQDFVIIMAGDTLEQLANRSFKAGLHRVSRGNGPRCSAVYKLRARPEVVGPRYQVDYQVVVVQRRALGLPEL